MPPLNALLNPTIVDRTGLDDYLDNLADLLPTVERGIARLKRAPQDAHLIADIFRALHNLKGDAAICQVELGVLIAHPVETLFGRLRAHEVVFTDVIAEVVLLTMDRLELAVEALAAGRPLAHLKLPALVEALNMLASSSASMLEPLAIQLIEDVTGFRPSQFGRGFIPGTSGAPRVAEQLAADLRFFQTLAVQLDTRSPLFKGRSGRLLRLVLDTNAVAGEPIDPLQLEAAVYMHDIGMMFMPEAAWLKVGRLSKDELVLLQAHPSHAAGLLSRMPGWEEAAKMVEQHQERVDGGGYPLGLKGTAICAGAKLLAIADAFEAVTLKHQHRGQGRSLLRAVTEINANDNQFDTNWIQHFNTVVRRSIE